ncbi:MAG: ParA family protein [Anaplasmataceae bacterium]|nr:ParA family protein [Anaplasmataceae bacterium]
MARVIAICNAKGGVGKTTTAVNLGAYLAHSGKRVLLVDFDPQANASSALGHQQNSSRESVYHGLMGEAHPATILKPSELYNLHFIPSASHLAGAMVELVNMPDRERKLRHFLNRVRHTYDYVLIDLPPSLSLLTINGLMASNEIIIPVQAQYYSLEGLGQLLEMIKLVQNNLKHPVRVSGALITMFDENDTLSHDVAKEVREHFPHNVYRTQIPRSVPLAEAPSFSKPILLYRPECLGAWAYRELAREVIDQEKDFYSSEHDFKSHNFGNWNIV